MLMAMFYSDILFFILVSVSANSSFPSLRYNNSCHKEEDLILHMLVLIPRVFSYDFKHVVYHLKCILSFILSSGFTSLVSRDYDHILLLECSSVSGSVPQLYDSELRCLIEN